MITVRIICIGLAALFLGAGCVSKTQAKRQAQEAYMAGQNQALTAAVANANKTVTPTITIHGPVANEVIPWVDDLTLAQALLQADYQAPTNPKRITITRNQGEIVQVNMRSFLNGNDIPLQPGDRIDVAR